MQEELTGLLRAWSNGDEGALEALTPVVYGELHKIARSRFAGEQSGHTLQPTALVHEAFVSLIDNDVAWQDRAHFYALSARMMRRILINHANARNAAKRGGGQVNVTFADDVAEQQDPQLADLDEALTALAENDQRKAELIELSMFGGLTYREMTAVTGLSSSTIDRELRFAKAWLKDYLL